MSPPWSPPHFPALRPSCRRCLSDSADGKLFERLGQLSEMPDTDGKARPAHRRGLTFSDLPSARLDYSRPHWWTFSAFQVMGRPYLLLVAITAGKPTIQAYLTAERHRPLPSVATLLLVGRLLVPILSNCRWLAAASSAVQASAADRGLLFPWNSTPSDLHTRGWDSADCPKAAL